jgi:hypothetical protein
MKFTATLEQGGKTATGIRVPPSVVESLGTSKKPPVRVTINGYTYRSTVAVMGGVFMLGVSAEVRQHAGVAGGDQIEVDIELDTEPRTVAVPPDLAAALDADPQARQFFDGLSYSNKFRLARAVDVKSVDVRQQRIASTVSMLREGRSS